MTKATGAHPVGSTHSTAPHVQGPMPMDEVECEEACHGTQNKLNLNLQTARWWWHIPLSLTLGSQRQGISEFEASRVYRVSGLFHFLFSDHVVNCW